MVLSIILIILLFAISYFLSTQGFFSALIMLLLSVCCAALAVGTHEWVAQHWVAPYLLRDYSLALSLALIFGVSLSALRTLTDYLVRRAVLLHHWVDRIGGGVCGILAGLTVTGMAAAAIQQVPFDGSIIGYERVPMVDRRAEGAKPPEKIRKQNELLLRPDRFAMGMAALMSAGVFSGDRLLAADYPDLVEARGWVHAANREVTRYAPPDSLKVLGTDRVSFVYDYKPAGRAGRGGVQEPSAYEVKSPEAGHVFEMVHVRLDADARDKNKNHIFTLRQFRLVGRNGATGDVAQYFPIALNYEMEEEAAGPTRHIRATWGSGGYWPVVDETFMAGGRNKDEIQIVFEIPTTFEPRFLEYKQAARADVRFGRRSGTGGEGASSPPPGESTTSAAGGGGTTTADAAPPAESPRPERRSRGSAADSERGSGGNVRGLTTRAGESFFSEELPFPMRSYRTVRDLSVSRGKLTDGHVAGPAPQPESGSEREIKAFDVPREKRLLHLNTDRLHTRSGLGRAVDFAASTVQNYFVEDDNGNRYSMVGKYAIADIEGQRIIELQYYANQAGTIGGVGKFQEIRDEHLEKDYQMVLLFLVDPGVKITAFSTGGSATRRDELAGENLVAPQ